MQNPVTWLYFLLEVSTTHHPVYILSRTKLLIEMIRVMNLCCKFEPGSSSVVKRLPDQNSDHASASAGCNIDTSCCEMAYPQSPYLVSLQTQPPNR